MATVDVIINGEHDPVAVNVDFEDRSSTWSAVNGSYHGFEWLSGNNHLNTVDGDTWGGGYNTAGTNIAYTPYSKKPVKVTRDDDSDFEFLGVELTAAWDSSVTATLTGYNNGVVVGTVSGNIYQSKVTEFDVNWGLIDELQITSGGEHLVLDNFEFMV